MDNPLDRDFMKQALKLAQKGRYTAFPNPCVGAVVVKDNAVMATGYHAKVGQDHAEVDALKKINFQGEGATLYVTLEPCNHFGVTPPCVDAIIQAKIKRVVVAKRDPNPKVNGSGIIKLREHGIEVTEGILEKEAHELNKGFFKRMQDGLPWVRLKMGLTLDGKIADHTGDAKWITSEKSRQDVQHWRAQSDAIITGVSTILKDNPDMTVRDKKILNLRKKWGVPQQPLLVVCDTHLRTPKTAKIFQTERTILLASIEADNASHPSVMRLPMHHERIDLRALIKVMATRGHNEVMIEAGSTLAGAFLEADLVDELILYYAPKVLGDSAHSAFQFREAHGLMEMKSFLLHSVKTFDEDIRVVLHKSVVT